MKVLGIDPGLASLGWGVIDGEPVSHVDHGKIETSSEDKQPKRLADIAREVGKLLEKYEPGVMAVEDTSFMGSKYANSSDLNRVIGVLMLIAERYNVKVVTYTPLEWKKMTIKYAGADKRRVQETVQRILGLEKPPRPQHASDALAVAIAYTKDEEAEP